MNQVNRTTDEPVPTSMADFTDEELSLALDEALIRQESKIVWIIVDEMQRRDGSAEL